MGMAGKHPTLGFTPASSSIPVFFLSFDEIVQPTVMMENVKVVFSFIK
jgi:hypothetical protein